MLDKIKPQLSALTSFVTFRLAQTHNKLNAQATFLLKSSSGLTLVEWRIIQLLRLHEGATMSKLAAEVLIDKGQLSRKVSAMVAKGLITTQRDKSDQRKQKMHLTPTASAISDKMFPVMQKRQELLVEGVSDADLAAFFRVLAVIDKKAERRDIQ